MNKNAIQKYAIWARNELIEQVKQRAYQYGITDKGYGDENAAVIAGHVLSQEEKQQRHSFVDRIRQLTNTHSLTPNPYASAFAAVVEEVAYTWFNRFVALRYMEVNDYLPTRVRVFSDTGGNFNPEILKDVLHLDIEGLDKSKVSELLNANKTEELYRYLLLTQCNALNSALPEMFEKLGSYTEMLLPNNILKPDSVLGRLVTDIPEDDFRDAVQIIGWLYQYYNTEPKQAVFDGLKKNVKITKEKIPAATQLFTPDWIVRYMVENSLGRLWLESHPNDALKANWKYYLDEAEQTPEVVERLRVLRLQSPVNTPEDIRLIDPCMGSGHILVYAFDVLMQIYESEGYNPRDAAKLILEKNIYGLDIDRRAYQLAYFALMMKARQYNRRIFTEDIKPQVYHPAGFPDGEEYGSLVRVDTLPPMPMPPKENTLFTENYENTLNAWNFMRLLSQKYDIVVTNPPYMGSSGMGAKMSEFVKKNYPDSKSDLFSAFIERGLDWIKPTGYNCMVTMQSWMFLSSFETMRKKLLSTRTITNLLHMENMVMGIAFGTAVANLYGQHIVDYKGQYNYMTMKDIDDDKPIVFPTAHKRNCTASAENFEKIPGSPVAYWVSEKFFEAFEKNKNIGQTAVCAAGVSSGNNDIYLKLWFEVQNNKIAKYIVSNKEFITSNFRYAFCNKGGSFRKWYGNNEYIALWKKANEFHRDGSTYKHLLFKEGLTWSAITSGKFSIRYYPEGFIFDHASPSMFLKSLNYLYLYIGLLNSHVVEYMLNIINPTINMGADSLRKIPVIFDESKESKIENIVKQNISLSRTDWDAFETSWDFKRHPLISEALTFHYGEVGGFARIKATGLSGVTDHLLENVFEHWETTCNMRFNQLKANEEELNRIFIDIYGLSDELTPEVEDKDVTVRKADLSRDIKSFISYAVGCMFGRYSLDTEGLAYAGGDWDNSKYITFIPDKDNILPICDDEYFDDDIFGRFVDFVRVVYGANTLEDNLKFIADTLGGKGTPREVIRNYFLNDFYKDHCKIYQKRPIYWLFDSGKKNGFKALIYMHRYQSDLLAKLRTDYVHEQQERYRTQLSHIATTLNTATGAERARLLKQQDKLSEQLKEITAFEEKVHHLADQNIEIDLDDGVKKNYEIFADVLAKI